MSKQLDLSFGTADSPRGIFGGADVGLPAPEPCEVPKPKPKESNTSPTVTPTTMEMVAIEPDPIRSGNAATGDSAICRFRWGFN